MAEGPAEAKTKIDAMLKANLPPALTKPVFYPVGGGWRALAKAHMSVNNAPIHVVHGYTLDTDEVRDFAQKIWRMPPDKLLALPGVPSRRARTLPAAALLLDRVLKRLAPERVVFSALGLREGWLYSQLTEQERYLDPLIEGAQLIGLPLARVPGFAPRLVRWTANLFPGETPADTRLRVAICALSDHAWRDHPDVRAEESFRRLLHFRSSASIMPSACSWRAPSTPVTAAGRTTRISRRPIRCCRKPPASARRCWAAPLRSPTVSPQACPRCSRDRNSASRRIASTSKSAISPGCRTARLSRIG